jgi:hypothetical protein
MRSLFFALALSRTQQQQPMAMPPPMRLLDRVLMQVGIPDTVEHFRGSFYGVSASVELNMRTRVAKVHLNGAPLGGRISGIGWLHDRQLEEGKVVLEPTFEHRLRRRFVTVYRATFDRKRHTVTVGVKIPVLGAIELTLT